MNTHTEGKKQAPVTTDKTVERKGKERGRGKNPLSKVPALETRMLQESADMVKLLECLVAQEHVESWHMHRSKYC